MEHELKLPDINRSLDLKPNISTTKDLIRHLSNGRRRRGSRVHLHHLNSGEHTNRLQPHKSLPLINKSDQLTTGNPTNSWTEVNFYNELPKQDLFPQTGVMQSILGLAKWKAKIRESHRKNTITGRERFRRIANFVSTCLAWCKLSYQRAEEIKDQLLSVTQKTDNYVIDFKTADGLYFDPKEFKSNRIVTIPQEARKILEIPPKARTEKDLQYLQIALRGIKAFAEYPMVMRQKLCRSGWYESFGTRRAIIRQGHPPMGFYFILSGTVVVTAIDPEDHSARTLGFLNKGMEFGELALVNKTTRSATVISNSNVELLVISGKEFENIYMSGGISSVMDKNSPLVKNLGFLQDWPFEQLHSNSSLCTFRYYGSGQVITKDSNTNDWIFIVKSGSLSVFKQLDAVSPNRMSNEELERMMKATLAPSSGLTIRRKFSRRRKYEKEMLAWKPREVLSPIYQNNIEMELRLAESLPGITNKAERLGILDYDAIMEKYQKRVAAPKQEVSNLTLPRINTGSGLMTSKQLALQRKPTRESTNISLTELNRNTKGVYLSTGRSRDSHSGTSSDREKSAVKDPAYLNTTKNNLTSKEKPEQQSQQRLPSITEAVVPSTFIRVQQLEAGQYFGITDLLFEDQPSLSIVSDGAEVIMIAKRFFQQHTSEATLRSLRAKENPYPRDEEMQQNLQTYVDWGLHRREAYQQTVREKRRRKSLHKQYSQQYIGEYNHRTGPLVSSYS